MRECVLYKEFTFGKDPHVIYQKKVISLETSMFGT